MSNEFNVKLNKKIQELEQDTTLRDTERRVPFVRTIAVTHVLALATIIPPPVLSLSHATTPLDAQLFGAFFDNLHC